VSKMLREFVKLVLNEVRNKNKRLPFDWSEFKSFTTEQQRLEYASSRLQFIGEGSSRKVFALSSKRALKIAAHQFGRIQNECELDSAKSEFITKVFEHEPNYEWIVTELVNPCESLDEVEDFLGIKRRSMYNFMTTMVSQRQKSALDGARTESPNSPATKMWIDHFSSGTHDDVLQRFVEFVFNWRSQTFVDVAQSRQWGKAPDGRIVLLDYGA